MLTSKLTTLLCKATPALIVGFTLGFSSLDSSQNSALAQTEVTNTSELPAAFDSSSNPGSSPLITAGNYFQPPRNPRPRGPRTTTGTRSGSCVGDPAAGFTIFGINSVVGHTAATHPEFVWYLPESDLSFPVTFRLLAPNADGIPVPIHTVALPYTSGFTKYQLPTNLPALSANKEYRWQVIVECDPGYRARSLAQELSFEVVALPAAAQLPDTATQVEKALAYAKVGLWHDAIAQVALGATPEAKQIRSGLLRDLAETEMDNEALSQDLLNIADLP
ncbi:MAG: DUF928 domain-containing protein [Phormidesmis sp.]